MNKTTTKKTPAAPEPKPVSDQNLRRVIGGAAVVIAQDKFSSFFHS